MNTPELVLVGGPSLDTLVVEGREHRVVGGAGFITAVAARVTGATVGLVARVPAELPQGVARAFQSGGLDPGGLCVHEGSLPGFRISYDAEGVATYDSVSPGLEGEMRPEDVPRAWLAAPWIHVSPLGGSVRAQREMVRGLRERGWSGALSVGVFLWGIREEPEALQELILEAQVLFLNEAEVCALFGGAELPGGLVIYETRGSGGVRIHREGAWRDVSAQPVTVTDPTGAGDSLCGGVLGALVMGAADPVAQGMARAREVLSDWGAAALLSRLPSGGGLAHEIRTPASGVVEVDRDRLQGMGERFADVAQAAALDFTGFPFPDAQEPLAMETLAVATLHQYGFWIADDVGYREPMYGVADGQRWKGSDYIWQAFTRAVRQDPSVVSPERMAEDPLLFDRICLDDTGQCPVPSVGSHRSLHQGWGRALVERGGFAAVLTRANESTRPVRSLLDVLSQMPGYGEDPMAKKAMLLAVVLARRPEGFLRFADPESIGPIVDYHIMRGCLRTGCIEVVDASLRARLEARQWVSAGEEAAIRSASHQAIQALCEVSGLGVDAVDGFFFVNGRSRCLEMEPPRCEVCPIAENCARRERLFQPVYRTTLY